MSRHSLSLSPEQLTAFDLDAFVAHAEALNLYQHTVLPLPPLTQFEVGGIAFRGMEGGITQNNHALFNLPNQPLKGIVGDIGRGTCLPHDQYLCQLRKAEGGLRGMNTTQASDLVENLAE